MFSLVSHKSWWRFSLLCTLQGEGCWDLVPISVLAQHTGQKGLRFLFLILLLVKHWIIWLQLWWMIEKVSSQQGFCRLKLLLLGEMRKGPYLQKSGSPWPLAKGRSVLEAFNLQSSLSSWHCPAAQFYSQYQNSSCCFAVADSSLEKEGM